MFRTNKVWEQNKVKEYFSYINNINDFEKFIFENEVINICQCDSYIPRQEEGRKFCLDADCDSYNFSYIYTDFEHSIACFDYGYFGCGSRDSFEILINSEFYFKYRDEIISCLKRKVILDINNNIPVIRIPDIVIDGEILTLLEQKWEDLKNSFIIFSPFGNRFNVDIDLEERFNKLDNLADEKLDNPKYDIGEYSASDLVFGTEFNFDCLSLSDEEISNFRYLSRCSTIGLTYPNNKNISSRMYLEKLLKIFKILETHERKYHISIKLIDSIERDMAVEMGFLKFDNIYLEIYGTLLEGNYDKEKLLSENDKLEELIKDIKESNLSPYEKYLAVYNRVKNGSCTKVVG